MFDAIYQLDDSISDTGNLIRENLNTPFSHLPYGETFFNNPTGRCSNGLLMIDYFVNPYLNKDALTNHGVNFAVAGSTALSSELLSQKKISSPVTNSSLNHQLDWMFSHFKSICYNQRDCNEKLHNALFLVDMVPDVVQSIKIAIERVISYGATRVVVPGNFPIGCFPIYLTGFQTNDTTAYDELHCLKDLNDFATYHNDQIKEMIEALKALAIISTPSSSFSFFLLCREQQPKRPSVGPTAVSCLPSLANLPSPPVVETPASGFLFSLSPSVTACSRYHATALARLRSQSPPVQVLCSV
ncbi:unnamed protein product [Citrullus colocynthis]|uniref:Uncharacterized protein n=1 Tax=Citrullus colocynthis TaxID=252529 RepID=A0ABP0XN11_9ROSI